MIADLVSNELYDIVIWQDRDGVILWTLDVGASQARESAVPAAFYTAPVVWQAGPWRVVLARFQEFPTADLKVNGQGQLVGDIDGAPAADRAAALAAYAIANGGQIAVHVEPEPVETAPQPGLVARALAIFAPKP